MDKLFHNPPLRLTKNRIYDNIPVEYTDGILKEKDRIISKIRMEFKALMSLKKNTHRLALTNNGEKNEKFKKYQ